MATRAGIDARSALRLIEDNQHMVYAIKAEFDTSTIRLHSGLGDLTINSETYTGAGTLLAISDIEDSNDLKSSGVTFNLSGMNPTVLGYALNENLQNRNITMLMAFISAGTDHVEGFMTLYKGRMISSQIQDNTQAGISITLTTENRLIDLDRPSNFRYTKESQVALNPSTTDTGFDAVDKLQDTEISWGSRTFSGGGAFGTGVSGNRLNESATIDKR
ncbi:MAG: hypothetical protein CMC82_04910 [Flavobacteriaceae bacterium]|nr:hypothetical protein [Flavobacteriaceae bacterium]|tara:strand:- start:5573 stop:6226 length:654 start_codon:yes stop_codon:yes gene_type:complete